MPGSLFSKEKKSDPPYRIPCGVPTAPHGLARPCSPVERNGAITGERCPLFVVLEVSFRVAHAHTTAADIHWHRVPAHSQS